MIKSNHAVRYASQIQADIEELDVKAMQLRAELRTLDKNSNDYKTTFNKLHHVYKELIFLNQMRSFVASYIQKENTRG